MLTPLPWTPSTDPDYDFTGSMEFCVGTTTPYGYRLTSTDACSSPGPLLRMAPGVRYKLMLTNTAPTGTIPTNLHTHGLHISGDGNSDDVTR